MNRRDVIECVMYHEKQITQEAVKVILSSSNPDRFLDYVLTKYEYDNTLVLTTDHVNLEEFEKREEYLKQFL